MKRYVIFYVLLVSLIEPLFAQRAGSSSGLIVNYKPGKGMPQFPGGLDAFRFYVEDHVKWNNNLYQSIFNGSTRNEALRFSFVVDAGGNVTDIKVLKHLGFGTREELIRVLGNSPKWKPALMNQKKISVRYLFEVNVPPPPMSRHALDRSRSPGNKSQIRIDEPKGAASRVEVEPQFPGGSDAFLSYVRNNYHCTEYVYSQISKNGETPTIDVSFVVDAEGCVVETKILADPGFGAAEELARVLQYSPRWKPGRQNNRPVRVQFTMPLKIYPPDFATIPTDSARVLFVLPFNHQISRDIKLPTIHFSKEKYVFSERVNSCNSGLAFEFDKRVLGDRYTILEKVKESMPADTLKKLLGRVAVQLWVDTGGTSCLTSYSHAVNLPYKTISLGEVLAKLKWKILPDKSGMIQSVNVLMVFTFSSDKIIYQHIGFNPGSPILNEIEFAELSKSGRY